MPTPAELRAANCWFPRVDRGGDKATTLFKRALRLRQHRWREQNRHPSGFEPYGGGAESTPVGSRLELEFARRTGANLLTAAARAAAKHRLSFCEPYQLLMEDRLFADLLSSMPMCFNLLADVANDGQRARAAMKALWPDAPDGDIIVRFEHSPGRRDELFLNNKSAFDVALEIDLGADKRAVVGIETKLHEHAKKEGKPKPKALSRYREVAARAGIFVAGAEDAIVGTRLQQLWLDHLLVLSMLQHPSRKWTWGRFVLVFPEENPSFTSAAAAYRALLTDARTFETRSLRSFASTPELMDDASRAAFHDRYL